MTETAGQLLAHVVPVCQWLPQDSPNPNSTISTYPRFPVNVREWVGFRQAVAAQPAPLGHFLVFPADDRPLRVEADVSIRFQINVIWPVETLLQPQGAVFETDSRGLLGSIDYILCTDNQVPKMPAELRTRHNLNLCGYNFWEIYRAADRCNIEDPNFKFKKRILSQIFGQMACNGLHYGILTNYSDTYFLKREEADPNTLYVSRVFAPGDANPTLRECVYYMSQLAVNDITGIRFGRGIARQLFI